MKPWCTLMGQSNEIGHHRFFLTGQYLSNVFNVNFLKIDSFSPAKQSLVTLRNLAKFMHCKDTVPKIQNKYSHEKTARLQSQFLHSYFCERFINSSNMSAHSTTGKQVGRTWEYIGRRMNVKIGTEAAQFPFLGIHILKFLCSVTLLLILFCKWVQT